MSKLFSPVFLIFVGLFSFGQKPADVFAWHRDSLTTQHIYVQFDKQAYVAGDTAWFKGYLYSNYSPSILSSNFFIDLVDENGNIIDAKKLPVIDGAAIGNFDLPANLKQGVYVIRAYTNWLTNLDQSFIFKKPLPVFNPAQISTQAKPATEYKFEIFPEGQKLINGLPNNVAYRATDEQMQVVPVRADLVDSKGRKIGNLANGKEGQGIFSFTPVAKEKYSVSVVFPDQSIKTYDFPVAQETGIILTVADEDLGKSFSAITSQGFIKENETVELVAVMDNHIVLDTKVPFKNSEALGLISTNNLRPGILQVMLFSKDNKLLASRTAVIQNNKLTQKVDLNREVFSKAPRGVNVFTFSFPEIVTGNFSVAITDADKELAKTNHDIFTSLLIESGAKEFIADPKVNDEQTGDLVTFSNRWYGGDWQSLQSKKQIAAHKENFLTINGKVMDPKTMTAIADGDLKVIVQQKNLAQKDYQLGLSSKGSFHLDSLIFEDSARIYYELVSNVKNKKAPPVQLLIEQPKDDHSTFLKNIDYGFTRNAKAIFADKSISQLATSIQSKLFLAQNRMASMTKTEPETQKKIQNKQYAGGIFSSSNGKTYDLVKDPPNHGGINVFDYLNGQIPGLEIYKGAQGYQLWSNRSPSLSTIKQGQGMQTVQVPAVGGMRTVNTGMDMNQNKGLIPAVVYLDEVETTPNVIATIPVQEIALVKYYDPGSIMLPGVGGSAVFAVWKKTESADKSKITDDMNYVMAAGYSSARVFYSPDYSIQNNMVEDNRTTLYWNPAISVSNEKEFKIKFYNSDAARKFHIVLEGFTADGKLVHFEKIIE